MRARIFLFTLALAAISYFSYADQWDDLVSSAREGQLSKAKKKTKSGKRVMREKLDRIAEIDGEVQTLLNAKDLDKAEAVLKEALKLTIEYYGYDDIKVSERFISLGIFYMDISRPELAEPVFQRAERIGEEAFGAQNYKLMNVYRFLSVCYFQQGKFEPALAKAELFRANAVEKFGEASKEAKDAQGLVATIRSEMKT